MFTLHALYLDAVRTFDRIVKIEIQENIHGYGNHNHRHIDY